EEDVGTASEAKTPGDGLPGLNRTIKVYIGGRQVRPDGAYSRPVFDAVGTQVGEVGDGNRKDIRNAVEAARKAVEGWGRSTAHLRAQILYYLAENLSHRSTEFADRIRSLTGVGEGIAQREVAASISRLFSYAALADKWEGAVHLTPFRNVTLAMKEPIGVMGVVCPERPSLLGFLSTILPPVSIGNTVVAVPSERWPLLATDCYQLFDTSDIPAGVINLVTGSRDGLTDVLAAHDDVDGLWYWGSRDGATQVQRLSAGNMKRTWVENDPGRDWFDPVEGEGEEFLREATQVKNIWIPYGA
ncbi:MAG: aldehyde dehydrogenase, partial [Gemmatimonadales bacterium]